MSRTTSRSRRTRKIAALAAGALVIGLGATYTLASWTDSEWVFGGASGTGGDPDTPGVGTGVFEVQQNTSSPFSADAANWADREANPGGGLTFTAGALSLSPGDTVYAPVALRTTAASTASASVTLQPAVAAAAITPTDANGDLWKSLQISVYTATAAAPPAACSAAGIASGWTQILNGQPLATVAGASQTLQAAAGSTQHYCFAVHLPTALPGGVVATSIDQLQGRTVAPAWEFRSVSQ